MMTKKKLSEIKADVAALLNRLPRGWLAKEVKTAKGDSDRDLKTLEMLCAALENKVRLRRKSKTRRPVSGGSR
jgi:hypothetical protein